MSIRAVLGTLHFPYPYSNSAFNFDPYIIGQLTLSNVINLFIFYVDWIFYPYPYRLSGVFLELGWRLI